MLYLSVLDYPSGWRIAAPSRTFIPELRKRWQNVTAIELSDRTTPSEIELVRAMAPRFDAVIASVFVRTASFSGRMDLTPALQRLLQDITRQTSSANKPFITTFFGNPYVATFLPDLPAMLLTYDFYDRAEASAVRAIAGEAPIGGPPADRAAGHVRRRARADARKRSWVGDVNGLRRDDELAEHELGTSRPSCR